MIMFNILPLAFNNGLICIWMIAYINAIYGVVAENPITLPTTYPTLYKLFINPVNAGGNWGQQKTAYHIVTGSNAVIATWGDQAINFAPWYIAVFGIGY